MKPNASKVRVIAGKWRGRKIYFPEKHQLRPTPDRIRETLFNWLAPHIANAACLDMFAGSGVLSFEALSRGAAHVYIWDQSKEILTSLRENAARLGATNCEISQIPFPKDLPSFTSPRFDLVFLDPPFHQNYIEKAVKWLENAGCLKENALIYIETESSLQPLPTPDSWNVLHAKKAGQVNYYLIQT